MEALCQSTPASTATHSPGPRHEPQRGRTPPNSADTPIRGGTGGAGTRWLGWAGSSSLQPLSASVNQRRFPASPRSDYTQDEAGSDTLPLINNSAWLRARGEQECAGGSGCSDFGVQGGCSPQAPSEPELETGAEKRHLNNKSQLLRGGRTWESQRAPAASRVIRPRLK